MTTGYPDYASRVGTQGGLRNVSPTHGFSELADKAVPLNVNQDGSLYVVCSTRKTISAALKIIPFKVQNDGALINSPDYNLNQPLSKGKTCAATSTLASASLEINAGGEILFLRVKNTGASQCYWGLFSGGPNQTTFDARKAVLEAGGELTIQNAQRCLNFISYIAYQTTDPDTTTLEVFVMANQNTYTITTNPDAEDDDEGDKAANWE